MKIEVGKKYVTRDGQVVTCVEYDPRDKNLPFKIKCGTSFYWVSRAGKFDPYGIESTNDIVAEYVEQKEDTVTTPDPTVEELQQKITELQKQLEKKLNKDISITMTRNEWVHLLESLKGFSYLSFVYEKIDEQFAKAVGIPD